MSSTSWGLIFRCHRAYHGTRDTSGSSRMLFLIWTFGLFVLVTLPWSVNGEPGKHLPPKSAVWTYFVKIPGGGKCKIYQQEVKGSGNTTNLKFHLNRSHPKLEMTAVATQNNSMPSRKRQHMVSLNDDNDNDAEYLDDPVLSPALSITSVASATSVASTSSAVSLVSVTKTKQPRLDIAFSKQKSFQDGGSKAADVTNKLLFMIAKDNLPFQTVEKEGFQVFVKALAPLYKLPSRKKTTSLMEEKYEVLSNMIKIQLSTTEHLSLTTDVWTDSLNVKSFLGVTAHFILNGEHKSVTIGVTELDDRHTAEYLKEWLIKIVEEWKVNTDSILVVVSDSGANIKKAIRDAFGADKHLSCFAHTLNLAPSKIIESDNDVSSLCKKVKTIVTYFKKSVAAADKLRTASDLKLIQSVDTRWNSTHDMLARFIKLSESVGSILLQCPTAPPMLTASELQTVKEFVELLKPFESATKIVCGEAYLTGSKVVPIVNTLRTALQLSEPNTETGERMKHLLLEQFFQRFNCIEQVSPLAIATILDPRFKRIHFNDKVACSHAVNKITRVINSTITENVSNEPQISENCGIQRNDFWSYHENLVSLSKSKEVTHDQNEMPVEFKYYLNQPPTGMEDCPIKFWSLSNHSPLSKLARKYLAMIATSVPSERLFSKAGRILSESRNRLSGEHLQQLLFLGSLAIEDWHFD